MLWKRNTDDPLIRMFLDRYSLHLLAVPREGAAVGDLYVYDGKRVSAPGKVMYLLEPPLELPPVTAGEVMADVSGTVSNSVSLEAGFGLLEGFLAAMGAVGIVSSLRASWQARRVGFLRFRFSSAVRDSVDVLLLGSRLIRHKLVEDHPLHDEDHRYYLVTAVARTPSISIVAESAEGKAVAVDIGAARMADVGAGVSVQQTSEGEVTFAGSKSLAFGVELHELQYDSKRGRVKLRMPEGAVRVRSRERGGPQRLMQPAVIGGPEDDVFLPLGEGTP